MLWKSIILLSFASCVLGDGPHAISEQRIKIIHKDYEGHHGELSHIGSKKPEHHEEYAPSYPSYEFSYKVNDPHTHDIKGQEESRKGDEVKGEYWLIEPDGRKRIVTYHADKHSGFHAIVQYSDDHHHHEHKKEEKKEEKKDEKGEGEEGGEAEEEAEVTQEGAAEEEGEEGRGAEETRGRPEEVGRWIHDRNWGYRSDVKRYDSKRRDEGKYDYRGDDRRREEQKQEHYFQVRGDGERRREEEHKKIDGISILSGLGSYGRRDNRERAEWHGHDGRRDKYEGRDETRSQPAHQKLEQRPALPTYKSGPIVRENYVHPRFYRRSQNQRKTISH